MRPLSLLLVAFSAGSVLAIPWFQDPSRIPTPLFNGFEPVYLPYCKSREIGRMDLGGCDCAHYGIKCETKECDACGSRAQKEMKSCKEGCTNKDFECYGCGLYFSSICHCLKNPAKCPSSGEIRKKGDPVWVFLQRQQNLKPKENLITPNKRIPGILELASEENMSFGNQGWAFAQTKYKVDTEALAMNNYRARTQEQVHIHTCPVNEATRKLLSEESPPSGPNLVQINKDKQMFCIVREKGDMFHSFAAALETFLRRKTYLEDPAKDVCDRFVGAGIMRDKEGKTWACATTNRQGPLFKFCEPWFVRELYGGAIARIGT